MVSDHFAGEIARHYDRDHAADASEVDAAVDALFRLADGGPALEFAISTGRIALPLAARGVSVAGIELSRDMLGVLRAKPGGAALPVTQGDMAVARAEGAGRFALVYLVFNTITNLTTQEAQAECFRNAAAHLAAGGRFVVQSVLPPVLRKYAFARSDSHWGIDEYDPASQNGVSHHVWFDEDGTRRFALPFRAVYPSELDLMARIAGLQRERRWGDWTGAAYTADSRSHVSVWLKPDGA